MADIVLKNRDGNPVTHEGVTAVNLLLADGTEYIAPIITGDDGGSIANLHFAFNALQKTLLYSSYVYESVQLSVDLPADAKIQKVLVGSRTQEHKTTNASFGPVPLSVVESTDYTVSASTSKITITASAYAYKSRNYYGSFGMWVLVIYTV